VQVNAIEFNAAGGASGEANNEAVAALAGVRPGHLLLAEWANSVGRPCHYLAADLAARTLVLAIRCAARRTPEGWSPALASEAACAGLSVGAQPPGRRDCVPAPPRVAPCMLNT